MFLLLKRNLFLVAGIALLAIGGSFLIAYHLHANVPMRFEVVTTPEAQALGLGGRATIPDNYGMLFVFTEDRSYGFWMKDMLAPIDIIWLDDTGHVVTVDASVSPDTYPKVFYAPQPVKYVLETRAGYAHDHAWKAGTPVALPVGK